MICGSCKKEVKQVRADWTLPPKERVWICDKCYFPSRNKTNKKHGRKH